MLKVKNKAVSVFLSVVLLIGVLPLSVNAGQECVNIVQEDFENGGQFLVPDGENARIKEFDTYGIGSAFYTTAKKERYSVAFTPVQLRGEDIISQAGVNTYAETEFDLYTGSIGSSEARIKLGNMTGTVFREFAYMYYTSNVLYITGDYANSEGDKSGKIVKLAEVSDNTWVRVKIVAHITDKEKAVQEISAVLVDGKNMLNDSLRFARYDSQNIVSYNAIKIYESNPVSWAIDNISVKKYSSADGSSPIAEKGELIKLLRSEDDGNGLPKELAEIKETAISNAKIVYLDENATDEEITASIKKLYDPIEVEETVKEDFEDNDCLWKLDGETAVIKAFDEYAIGNACYTIAKKERISSTFSPVTLKSSDMVAELGKHAFAEAEFDLYTGSIGANEVRLQLGNLRETIFREFVHLYFRVGVLYIAGGYADSYNDPDADIRTLASIGDNRWVRIRIVLHITDAQKAVREISAVYVDGINCLQSRISFARDANVNITEFNAVQIFESNPVSWAIDNLTVYRYNSESGYSYVAPKDRLISGIRTAQRLFSTDIEESEREALKSAIKNSVSVLNADYAGYTEGFAAIANALHKIDSVVSKTAVKYRSCTTLMPDGSRENGICAGGTIESVTLEKSVRGLINVWVNAALYDKERMIAATSVQTLLDDATAAPEIAINLEIPENLSKNQLKLMVWSSEMIPLLDTVTNPISGQRRDYTFTVDETEYIPDTGVYFDEGGMLYLPAKNIINILTMELVHSENGYSAQREDGAEIVMYSDSRNAKINGTEKVFEHKCFMLDNMLMVPFEMLEAAFGASMEINHTDKTVAVNSNYIAPLIPDWDDDMSISFKPSMLDVLYEITGLSEEAQVEVWTKSYAPLSSNLTMSFWKKAHTPQYKDGALRGYAANLSMNRDFDVRLRVTENGVSKLYQRQRAFKTANYRSSEYNDNLYITDGTLLLIPTFENISYYLDWPTGKPDNITAYYRKSYETQWQDAYSPYYDEAANQIRGSITYLKENTSYDVKLEIAANGTIYSETATVNTWSNEVQIAETVDISTIYSGGTLYLQDFKGNENGWIKITNNEKITVDGGDNYEAVLIAGGSHVIIDGLKIKGGRRYGINITADSDNIRIQNCDISQWGRSGSYDENNGFYRSDGGSISYDAAVNLIDVSCAVVERCYIHDSKAKTNSWNGEFLTNIHPNGSCGIYCRTEDCAVIRYNDFVGSRAHSFNDAIEGNNNGKIWGGTSCNADIYGNFFLNGEDDAIEIDGGQINVRVYENRIEGFLCGISNAPNMMGPSYIYRNLITNLGTPGGNISGRALKTGGSGSINGLTYLFNNTFDNETIAVDNCNYIGEEFHSVTRNNIFVSRTKKNALSNRTTDERDSNDFDMLYGVVSLKDSDGINSITGLPQYTDYDNAIFTLASGSRGIDAGEYLPNFSKIISGKAPDMGVFEYGEEANVLSSRPVEISADIYRAELSDGEEREVTIRLGNIDGNRGYSIIKNEDFDWIEISGDALTGIVQSNSELTFTIKADRDKCSFEGETGAILFRLDNGVSLPITVKLNNN